MILDSKLDNVKQTKKCKGFQGCETSLLKFKHVKIFQSKEGNEEQSVTRCLSFSLQLK